MKINEAVFLSSVALLTCFSTSAGANPLVPVQQAVEFTTNELPVTVEDFSEKIKFDQRCLAGAKDQIKSLLEGIELSLKKQMKTMLVNAFVSSKVQLPTTGKLATEDDIVVNVAATKMTVGQEKLNSWQDKVGELKMHSSLAPVAVFPIDLSVEAFVVGDPKPNRKFVAAIGGTPSYRIGIGYIAEPERNVVRDALDSIVSDNSSCVYTVLGYGYDIQNVWGALAQDGQRSISYNLRLRGWGHRGYSVSLVENEIVGKTMGYLGIASDLIKVPLQ